MTSLFFDLGVYLVVSAWRSTSCAASAAASTSRASDTGEDRGRIGGGDHHLSTNLASSSRSSSSSPAAPTLVLERSLTRILVGFVMLGNGVNLSYLVASGPAGDAPIIGIGRR